MPFLNQQFYTFQTRNYQPQTEKLGEVTLPPVEPSKVENLIEDQLKHSETSKPIAEVNIFFNIFL